MATINQVYTIINAAARMAFGEEAITVVDTSTLVSLGNKVFSSDTATDAYWNALVDRIGRTIFSIRKYAIRYPGLVKEPFVYGVILQKIYVDLPEAKPNNSWEIGKEGYVPSFAPVIKPSVKQKLFDKISTWEIDVTIPDRILKTAFLNAQGMAMIIDAIFVAMDNAMEIALENCANLTRASFIARKINRASVCGAINLLAGYKKDTGTALTVNNAIRNTDFLKYSSAEIALWSDRMEKMGVLFNDEGYKRHTPKELQILTVLSNFAKNIDFYLQADTWHNEITKLPYYSTVPYWQGSGTSYDFESVSSVNVEIEIPATGGSSTMKTVKQSGIVAILTDYEAMGVTIDERRMTTERNNKDEYTDYFNKSEMGYFNDMSENGIVFYLAEEAASA